MIRLQRFKKRSLFDRRFYATLKGPSKARHSILSIREEFKKNDNLNKIRLNSSRESLKNNIDATDATDATRSILQNKKASYFDPANSSLNLALDNTTLFNKISKDAEIRMSKRFREASNSWLSDYKKLAKSIPMSLVKTKTKSKDSKKELLIQAELEKHLKNATISPESAANAISAGDLVALNNDSVSLYIIVSCPTDLDSNSYTFINREGEIVYGPKQLIKLRFPGAVPRHLLGIIKDLVQLETKYLDMAPIGVTDATFSKSEQSKPKEIRKVSSKAQKISENDENRGHVDSSEIGGDFIVAQASSQLLTNSDVNTFHIPIRAREIYSKALTQISIKTFEKIPEISQKLEILHRVLQYDEDGDCLDSPRTISIFLLLHYIELFSLNMVPKLVREGSDAQGEADLFKTLRKKLSDSFSDFDNEAKYSNLGKIVPKDVSWMQFANEAYPVSTFMSLILALRTQGRLWNINQQNSTNPPLSVNILPLRNVDLLEKTISFLKFKNGDVKFADYLIKKLKKEKVDVPEYYKEIVQLFKDYTAGNFTNDPAAETALVSVIRLVDKSLKEENLYPERYTSLTYDYSRARGFELLQMLEDPLKPSSCGWENPANWSYALQLPNNNVLLMSDLSTDYYQYLDESFSSKEHRLRELVEEGNSIKHTNSNSVSSLEGFDVAFSPKDDDIELTDDFYTSDPLTEIREDFGNTPIYCIDSETAHEIDDGISINTSKDGEKYIISVHVANPTSYLKPFSTISNIAFNKGSTTYLPEGPSMMLPNIISKIAGLGKTSRTRTFVIQYTLDKSSVDSYIKQKNNDEFFKPDIEFSNSILKDIESSVDIKLCMAHNFPNNFTYSKVNEILNNEKGFESFKKGSITDVHSSNLFKLYNISTILKDIRIMVGNGLEMSIPRSSVTVDYTTGKCDQRFEVSENGYKLKVQDPSNTNKQALVSISNGADQGVLSKSQLLVSHFMISANYAASIFATKNNIPIIHRSQQMKLEDSILKKLQEISKRKYLTNEDLSIEDVSKVLSVLTSAKFLVEKKPHESLGLQGYATVTSPLRRFVDMINHWKFEEFLLSRANIPTSNIQDTQLYYMGNHLQTCELINKKMQSFSNKFWEGVFFKEYLKLLNEGEISKPVTFKLLLKSNPKFGNISVHVLGFNNLKATLESTEDVIEKFNTGEFRVGQVLTGNFQITKLDYIEDELVFSYK
ncbi:uncharacterized protein AC631_05240 [Debaryomyces fabryi]|uniref:RNB domain-containing protein n=1 Tax=Debaryomyces fabryi TaxID=58627 RepID=A0A0V1PS70_9ASCO|nr:uncharacterized protein AC631_05240 [Debaryomyces fabryi]KRZ98994.1 hypothetical protein AC631_05240 [Debaryomyces fabryi]CUM57390.1 unnamed protein product [Debaryomyces fabryi]